MDEKDVKEHAKGGDGENRLWAKDVKAAEDAGRPRAEGGNGNDEQQPGGSARITPIGDEIKRPIIIPPVLNRGGVWP